MCHQARISFQKCNFTSIHLVKPIMDHVVPYPFFRHSNFVVGSNVAEAINVHILKLLDEYAE